jgi:twinkle protein
MEAMSTAVYLYDISHAIIDNIQFMMGLSSRNVDRFYSQDLVSFDLRPFTNVAL